MKPILNGIYAVVLLLIGSIAHSAPVTVVTSFPKDLTDIYKKAFEQRYPNITIEFISKSTGSALSVIKESPSGQRPDVFWASAPDAFEIMAREKLLEKAPAVKNPAVPPSIGKAPRRNKLVRFSSVLPMTGIRKSTTLILRGS